MSKRERSGGGIHNQYGYDVACDYECKTTTYTACVTSGFKKVRSIEVYFDKSCVTFGVEDNNRENYILKIPEVSQADSKYMELGIFSSYRDGECVFKFGYLDILIITYLKRRLQVVFRQAMCVL